MKPRLNFFVGVILSVGFLFAFFCLSPAIAEEVEILKIGSNQALSGSAGFWGIGYDNAFKLAAKQINSAGGFVVKGKKYNWKIVSYDHKYVTTEAVSCANKLIYEDKVKYMTIVGATVAMAIAPITNKEKVLQACWAGGGKALTNPNYPLVFRHSPVDPAASQAGLYRWLRKDKNVQTIATIHPDDETGYSGGEGCKEAAEATGLKLVGQEFYPRTTTDFYPILSRIIAKKPDCIDMFFSAFGAVALMAKQLHELKYRGVVILWTVDPEKALKVAGAEALEGCYSYLTLAKMITGEQKKFYKDYVAEYGDWNEQALLAYDFVFTLTECIVEGQTLDSVRIADLMQDKEIPYLYGKGRYGMEKKFGIKRQGLFPTPLAQFKNGEWHHIGFIEPEVPR